jgi:plasmid stability protein
MSEQLLVRGLPDGTKALLRHRAASSRHSVEAEVRRLIVESLNTAPISMAELLADNSTEADFEWEPRKLKLQLRAAKF